MLRNRRNVRRIVVSWIYSRRSRSSKSILLGSFGANRCVADRARKIMSARARSSGAWLRRFAHRVRCSGCETGAEALEGEITRHDKENQSEGLSHEEGGLIAVRRQRVQPRNLEE